MQKTRKLRLRPETIRTLKLPELKRADAGYQGDPITPECPSEYPNCTPT